MKEEDGIYLEASQCQVTIIDCVCTGNMDGGILCEERTPCPPEILMASILRHLNSWTAALHEVVEDLKKGRAKRP